MAARRGRARREPPGEGEGPAGAAATTLVETPCFFWHHLVYWWYGRLALWGGALAGAT